jgi:hypothetical protein
MDSKFRYFAARLGIELEDFLRKKRGKKIDQTILLQIDLIIQRAFRFYGENFMVGDGMQIIDARAIRVYNTICLQWFTDFYPNPRYIRHHNTRPLGFFKEFDLYLGFQKGLSPTLIARFGNNGDEYDTFNPSLLGIENIAHYGEHFIEAYKRASFIGAFLGH